MSEKTWVGRIECGCGSMAVLLRGPAHLFERHDTMLRSALGDAHPYTTTSDGRLICTKCGQEIVATRSGDGEPA